MRLLSGPFRKFFGGGSVLSHLNRGNVVLEVQTVVTQPVRETEAGPVGHHHGRAAAAAVCRRKQKDAIGFNLFHAGYLQKRCARAGSQPVGWGPQNMPGPLDIQIGTDGGRITGAAFDRDNTPSAGALITLVPEGDARLRPDRYRTVTICGRVLSTIASSSFCSVFGICSLSKVAFKSPTAASNSGLVMRMPAWVVGISFPS